MSILTLLISHMVYFNNMKRNVGHIKVTQKPPQRMDYMSFIYNESLFFNKNVQYGMWNLHVGIPIVKFSLLRTLV